jgi:hypothetical protein
MTTWRDQARAIIARAIDEGRAAGLTDEQIRRNVDAAYPFGPRKYWPYQAWLKARRELLGLSKSISAGDRAKLSAWENDVPIVDPGEPGALLTPLERCTQGGR